MRITLVERLERSVAKSSENSEYVRHLLTEHGIICAHCSLCLGKGCGDCWETGVVYKFALAPCPDPLCPHIATRDSCT